MKKFILGIIILLSTAGFSSSQSKVLYDIHFSSGVVEGRLANGLRYILKSNSLPQNTLEMRLVMNVGSLQEEDSQCGAAHFLEHLAFADLEHFSNNSMLDYFQSKGMKFGYDINAFTGYDRTIYWLTLPLLCDKNELIDNSLTVIKDWLSGGILIKEQRLEAERGVILQELSNYKQKDKFYALKIGQGLHSKRLPLGSASDIKRLNYQDINSFYRKWYKPQNASLIIVGDVDLKELEGKIKRLFSNEDSSSAKMETTTVDKDEVGSTTKADVANVRVKAEGGAIQTLSYPEGISLKTIQDSLLSKSEVELIVPQTYIPLSNFALIKEQESHKLFIKFLNAKLRALGIENTEFTRHWYLADKYHFTILTKADTKGCIENIRTIHTFLSSMEKYGLPERELKKFLKKELFDYSFEGVVVSSSSQKLSNKEGSSSKYCDDFIDYALLGDITTCCDAAAVAPFLLKALKQLRSEDFQHFASMLLRDMKKSLLLCFNLAQGDEKISEKELADIIYSDKSCSKKEWRELVKKSSFGSSLCSKKAQAKIKWTSPKLKKDKALLNRLLAPKDCKLHDTLNKRDIIEREREYLTLGIKELKLRNGLTLLFKPTNNITDIKTESGSIYLHLLGRGGLLDLEDRDYVRLKDAAAYVDLGGVATWDSQTLSDFMYENSLSMVGAIGDNWHELFASCQSPQKASLLLRLVYEKIHNPQRDYHEFKTCIDEQIKNIEKALKEGVREELSIEKRFKRNADRLMTIKLDSLLGNVHSLAARNENIEELKALSLDDMADYYVKLFSNPSLTTILFVGSFDYESLKEEALAVFSRMKINKLNIKSSHFQVNNLPYVEEFEGEKSTMDTLNSHSGGKSLANTANHKKQISCNLVFCGNYEPSLRNGLILKLMRDVFQDRLLKKLRQEANIVYSPFADLYYKGVPQQLYYFSFLLSTSESQFELMKSLVFGLIADLKSNKLLDEELQQFKLAFLNRKSQALSAKTPLAWREQIAFMLKNGESLSDFDNYERVLSTIEAEDLRRAFMNLIDEKAYILLYKVDSNPNIN